MKNLDNIIENVVASAADPLLTKEVVKKAFDCIVLEAQMQVRQNEEVELTGLITLQNEISPAAPVVLPTGGEIKFDDGGNFKFPDGATIQPPPIKELTYSLSPDFVAAVS